MDHATPPPDLDRDRDARAELAALRRTIDRDHVSVAELLIWLVGVVAVLIGMHHAFAYWADSGPTGDPVAKPGSGAETIVWVGRIGTAGYALLQLSAEQPDVARFRDGPLARAYGEAVRTYWLGLYAFGDAALELDVASAVAHVNGVELAAKAPPSDLPPALAIQLACLTAPVALPPGKMTRALLVFADHDPAKLARLTLTTKGGPVVLESARRKLEGLEEFNERPFREFFESAHALAEPKR